MLFKNFRISKNKLIIITGKAAYSKKKKNSTEFIIHHLHKRTMSFLEQYIRTLL